MHIALISPMWPLGFPNGIVTYVHYLREGLREAGHRVSVLTLNGQGDEADGVFALNPSWQRRIVSRIRNVLHFPLDPCDRIATLIADALLRVHADCAIDLIEMEESFGWCAAVQRRLPMPVVVKLHGPAFLSLVEEELTLPASQYRIESERLALRDSLYVTSPSQDTLDRTRRHADLPEAWGRVIPNPIVLGKQTPVWSRAVAKPQTLLFVGRFDKRKGGDIVVRAFGQLLDQQPELNLVFVGPDVGVRGDDGQVLKLQEFAQLELPGWKRDRLRVMGPLSPDRVAQQRTEAAATLICSRWDNQPNTALEALYQACPVVAINTGGVGEVVHHGATGLLARDGDLDDFCRQVLWMLDNPHEAERFGLAGREHVIRAHDVQGLALQTADYYEQVCKAHAGR